MLDILRELFDDLEIEAQKIVDFIYKNIAFETNIFDSVPISETLDRPKQLKAKKGVYVFMIKDTVPLNYKIVSDWNNVGGAGFKSYQQSDLKEKDCLYVGSCVSKSIYTRLGEHYSTNCSVSALKLLNSKRKFILEHIQIYTFPLKKEYVPYCSIILPAIEKRLHDKLEPKAGSSRV